MNGMMVTVAMSRRLALAAAALPTVLAASPSFAEPPVARAILDAVARARPSPHRNNGFPFGVSLVEIG
jgi:hypothetical protein